MTAEPGRAASSAVAVTPFDDLMETSLVSSAAGRVQLQGSACKACGARMLGRRYACSGCMSTDIASAELATSGTVYTWTVVHVFPGADGPVPVAYVDLADGVRIFTRLADADADAAAIGARVRLAGDEGAWWFEHDAEAANE